MKKSLLILLLIVVIIGISSRISRADDSLSHISATPDIFDQGTFHLARYKSDVVIQKLGIINGNLLASFSASEHAWFFNNAFAPVNGSDPAKALGYPSMQTSDSLRSVPKKSPCEKFKDAISAVALTDKKTLCLSSSAGGDFTLRVLPSTKDKPIPIGFGKQPILEKTRVSWIGYDGHLYVAYLHPSLFAEEVTVHKTKTNPTVFLLRNGIRYSVPNEQTYYTWFDSFAPVTILTDKKLAAYPLQAKALYRPNTLIQFAGSPEVYVYQPANDPYLLYGKDTKIVEDRNDKWVLQDPKKKGATIDMQKRPALLRHITSESSAISTFGPSWNKHILVLNADLKKTFTISEKAFVSGTDIVYE